MIGVIAASSRYEMCRLNPLVVETNDPTNAASNNGVAIVSYSAEMGDLVYNINGGPDIPISTNPFTVSNLSSSTLYTITVKDNITVDCQQSSTFSLGETSFVFDLNWIMITYEFIDGMDFDTRTRIVTPDIGQNSISEYLGWSGLNSYPINNSYETWGGDNQGVGFESILIDVTKFKEANPTATTLVIDCRGFWYSTVGIENVKLKATLWKGGTPTKTGCHNGISTYYCWENPTSVDELIISSTGKKITTKYNYVALSGERVATFTYDLYNKQGIIDNNDLFTPSV